MIGLVLGMVAAWAEDAPAVGLPIVRLDGLGLGAPSVTADPPLARYPLVGGGWVVLAIAPDRDQASAAFDGMARTMATHWAPAEVARPGERALGDGTAAVLVLDHNAVVLVRSAEGHAADVAGRVLSALAHDAGACAGEVVLGDGRRADGCGRPR